MIDGYDEYKEKYEEPELHIKALLDANIITLDLRPRLLYPLDKHGIKTVRQLLAEYKNEFANVPQIGIKAIKEIENILSFSDLTGLV